MSAKSTATATLLECGFKVGDRVRPDWYRGTGCGVVVAIVRDAAGYCCEVRWAYPPTTTKLYTQSLRLVDV